MSAEPDVGWHRRHRTTDLVSAVCFALAVPAVRILGSLGGCLAAGLGILLTFAHHDRRIERMRGDLWLIDGWWLFRSWRVRRQSIQSSRVALNTAGTGWFSRRRTVLAVDGLGGPVMVESWRRPSERVYALPLAINLARWAGVALSGTLAPFDGRPDDRSRLASLRATLGRSDRERASSDIDRVQGRRPAWQIAVHAFIALEGVVLLAVSCFAGRAHGIDALALGAALPIGALLASYGLGGALPGKIVTAIGPTGLHVERQGPRRELIVQLPFAAVTWVGTPPGKTKRPTLRIGCGDAFVDLTGRKLGLGERKFATLRADFDRALASWLDDRLAEPAPTSARPLQAPAPPAGPVFLTDGRVMPASAVSVLAQLVPRLAILASLAFLAAAYLVNQALAHGPLLVPPNVRLAFPTVLPFLGLKAVALVIGAAASATITALAVYLFWCVPEVPGQLMVFLPMVAFPLVPVFTGASYGARAVDCLDICGGISQPARLPLTVYRDALQYGPYNFVAPGARRPDERDRWFSSVSQTKNLLDVRGLLGGRYLVTPQGYHATCDAWRRRLPMGFKWPVIE